MNQVATATRAPESSSVMFRAICSIHSSVGCRVSPATVTRRVSSWIEQHVVCRQTPPRQHLDREEIDCGENGHMCCDEVFPQVRLASLGSRRNLVPSQHFPTVWSDFDVPELDSAPAMRSYPRARFFPAGETNYQRLDLRRHARLGPDSHDASNRRTSGRSTSCTRRESFPAWRRRQPGRKLCAQAVFQCRPHHSFRIR